MNIQSWAMGFMLLIASGLAWRESRQPIDTTVHTVVVRVPSGTRVVWATARFERHSKDVALQETTNGDGLVPAQQTPGRVRSVELTYQQAPNACNARPTVMIDGRTVALWERADRMADHMEDGTDVVRCRFLIMENP